MKEKLLKKLKKDDRNFFWFWKNHIRTKSEYPYFMSMLSGSRKMKPEIKEIINNFLVEK